MRQLVGQRASRAEEKCLERRGRDAEDLGNLSVRASLELAQDERLSLLRRDLRERREELTDARVVLVVRARPCQLVVELDLARSRLLLSEALLDRVARDRQ